MTIHNECRYFCCAGCQSAAKTIVDAGLAEYYKFHKPDQHPVENWLTGQGQASFLHYDRDDTQAEFVQRQGEKHKSCIL
ncbi:MAG: heavy metal translocating P-type ATPase metal-binding domain-containing protein, partial [Reinekea sp.]|nr:heavy metal translocating P-type ATPase metal-binding domain-containing protein [Reinekea sp.]